LLRNPTYLRLWLAGAVGNGMRWLELLVVGIFTYDLTHSSFLVAVMTVARTLPMLLLGAFAGVVGEAVNRKVLLVVQMLVMAATAAVLGALAVTGWIRVWHLALGGAVAGLAWTNELSVRRRMIGESVMPEQVGPAIAFDTLTASVARVIGPLLGGALFEILGLAGAYLLSAALYLGAGALACSLDFRQERRRLSIARIPADLAEGLALARANRAVLAVIAISIIANSCGFPYSALVAPLGLHEFAVSPLLVGLLASAEPTGATLAGIAFSAGWLRLDRRYGMIRGSFLFFSALIVLALTPWYGLAVGIMVIGGFGTAAFSIMQTTLILTEAPAALRSRVMGLVTVCIGTGPLGVLAIGALAAWLSPARAILIMAVLGLAGLVLILTRLVARPA
ncbi:MAG TPA: MFS transporter, partial [Stellaceae bacterium]|nr:MFS transporter [Stellaceae bacterium]